MNPKVLSFRPLLELAQAFREPVTLDNILQLMVNTTATVLWTPRASVRLLDETNTKLTAIYRAGTPFHRGPEAEFKIGEGLLGWIAQHKKPLRTGHAERDARFVVREGMKGSMGSFLGVPLLAGDVCMGVLSAVEREPDFFTPQHQDLQQLIASICEPHLRVVWEKQR